MREYRYDNLPDCGETNYTRPARKTPMRARSAHVGVMCARSTRKRVAVKTVTKGN